MEPLQPRHVAANLHHTRRRPDESRSWLSSTTFSPRSFAREAMSGSTRTRRWSELGNGNVPTRRKSGSLLSGQNTPDARMRKLLRGST